MPNACVAIVDPYSAGALLATALIERGVSCVAIESYPAVPASMRSHYTPDAFANVIQADDNFDHTLAQVARHGPTHVMAGFESGVELAEELSERLSLPANDSRLRNVRRDKYLMSEKAKECGLLTALQFRSSDVDELVAWTRNTLDWPVIVKPSKSVATDHVFCCRDVDSVRHAATSILSDVNILGAHNPVAIVQEFLEGTEYAIDMVSVDAQPKLTAIWQYDRPQAERDYVGYDAMRLLAYEGPQQSSVRAYACEVLRALGIRFGPSHCELIVGGNGPVLVEIGARMSGGVNAVLSRVCGGVCQLDETVDAILAPEKFLERLDIRPQLKQHVVNVFLSPQRPGTLVRTKHVQDLRALGTLHSLSITTQPGDQLKRVAGLVTLVSDDIHAIYRDIDTIRGLESNGIFEVRETSRPP